MHRFSWSNNRLIVMIGAALLMLFGGTAMLATPTAQANASCGGAPFEEKNGLAVMEIESVDAGTGWDERDSIGGASGTYYEWTGPASMGTPGNGLMEYKVLISTPGTYRFQWRSRIAEGNSGSESNDAWLKAVDADDFYGEKQNGSRVYPFGSGKTPTPNGAGSGGWFKVYQNQLNTWSWQARTSDNDAHNIFMVFNSPGVYTLQVSGRSAGFAIDRMVLYKPDTVSESAATTALPAETLCSGLGSVTLSGPTGVQPGDASSVTLTYTPTVQSAYTVLDVYYPDGSFSFENDRYVVENTSCSGTCSLQVPTRGQLGTFTVWTIPGVGATTFGEWAASNFYVGLGPVNISTPSGTVPPAPTTQVTFTPSPSAGYTVVDMYTPAGGYQRYLVEKNTCNPTCSLTINTDWIVGTFDLWTIDGVGATTFGPWTRNTLTVGLADVTLNTPKGNTGGQNGGQRVTLNYDPAEGSGYTVIDVYGPNGSYSRFVVENATCSGSCQVPFDVNGVTGGYDVWMIPGVGPYFGNWALSEFNLTPSDLSSDSVDTLGSAVEAPPALDTSQVEAATEGFGE